MVVFTVEALGLTAMQVAGNLIEMKTFRPSSPKSLNIKLYRCSSTFIVRQILYTLNQHLSIIYLQQRFQATLACQVNQIYWGLGPRLWFGFGFVFNSGQVYWWKTTSSTTAPQWKWLYKLRILICNIVPQAGNRGENVFCNFIKPLIWVSCRFEMRFLIGKTFTSINWL